MIGLGSDKNRKKTSLSSQVFYTRTSRGNRIACMFVKCAPNARFTILHSHGNAVDLGQMSSFYLGLGSRWECGYFVRYICLLGPTIHYCILILSPRVE